MQDLAKKITACRLCAEQFAATHTAHNPRPVAWFKPEARILVAGQAPGMRVYETGLPFNDPSGDRLREWMGIERDTFYDRNRLAIVPMAFCFPGYDAKGSDLPPPKICAATWHDQVMEALGEVRLTLLVGGYAHRWHLGVKTGVTETVRAWRNHGSGVFPLPHPSWRNTAWLKKNLWFGDEVLPALRHAVKEALTS
ncbi:uracil-DNA glycosylase family protein [Alisedimentitalea sp. MJ-SS2]|uniref:uracil-DNA glycosylase family protein n=1 Tax=Aliisedimentitalea sp. MJ-SS2 TaxID=3049795 RepID=UPI002913A4A9|nr:uracil-DNA glycosylase family protein [Alisedimentitalea sp. MJ-SS2]MDU8928843.1 uracil-DNA glycosylase family protein [Alisedimentitalea sp. MJ-SS2]